MEFMLSIDRRLGRKRSNFTMKSQREQVISSLPLTVLWTDAGPLSARRVRYLTSNDAMRLIEFKRPPPPIIVADCGRPLRWVSWSDYWDFWRREAKPRLADCEDVAGPGAWEDYWYVASEWSTNAGAVISLEIARSAGNSKPAVRAVNNGSTLLLSDQEFCLDLYRCAVRSYQPTIEERTGIRLGEVTVKPITELQGDIEARLRATNRFFGMVRSGGAEGRIPRLAEVAAGAVGLSPACQCFNSIYISFTLGTQFHEEEIIRTTVHELAHCLWRKIARRDPRFFWRRKRRYREYKIVGEGFAVYAERVWFRDAYPPWLKRKLELDRLDEANLYTTGLRVIERLVEQHGQQILLRIPAKWKKLIRPMKIDLT